MRALGPVIALSGSLTSQRHAAKIAQTADYYAIPAPFPRCVVLFTCPCGAEAVESDLKRVAPTGWSTADDGSHRCPACFAESTSHAPSES